MQHLDLSRCNQWKGQGLQNLRGLIYSTLKHLDLRGLNQLTDGGVEHLRSLSYNLTSRSVAPSSADNLNCY
jgi:hypothetical protein